MKIIIELSLEHPVFFLTDPYVDECIPQYAGEGDLTYTDDCIVMRVRPYVDGPARVTIASNAPPLKSASIFSGIINCKSKILALSDSYRFNYCMVPVRNSEENVEIWKNIEDDDDIWIMVEGVVEY